MKSVFNISARDKERKIAKVSRLIPKYYDADSFTNEESIVAQISKLLKPNQWLRVEDSRYGKYDYSQPINYNKQPIGMKPIGIWASKGEWVFKIGHELTLLEVDYSRILVLTTKKDYLAFENKYCKKVLQKSIQKVFKKSIEKNSKKTQSIHKSSRNTKTRKRICIRNIQ